jgi:hypothetical protein
MMKKKPAGRVRLLVVVACAAVVGSALTGAFAGAHGKRTPKWPVSAYSHSLHRAHSASTLATVPLSGASGMSLAAVKGSTEVYIGHRYSPTLLDCVWERISPHEQSGGCGRASDVESKGTVGLYEATEGTAAHILAFVPDGVGSVVVTDSDGSSHPVAVTNNFAIYEDSNRPSSVSYTLPDGVNQTTNVAAWRLATHGPGAPGSGE